MSTDTKDPLIELDSEYEIRYYSRLDYTLGTIEDLLDEFPEIRESIKEELEIAIQHL